MLHEIGRVTMHKFMHKCRESCMKLVELLCTSSFINVGKAAWDGRVIMIKFMHNYSGIYA